MTLTRVWVWDALAACRFKDDPEDYIERELTPHYENLWGVLLAPQVFADLLRVSVKEVKSYLKHYHESGWQADCSRRGVLVHWYDRSKDSPFPGYVSRCLVAFVFPRGTARHDLVKKDSALRPCASIVACGR